MTNLEAQGAAALQMSGDAAGDAEGTLRLQIPGQQEQEVRALLAHQALQ